MFYGNDKIIATRHFSYSIEIRSIFRKNNGCMPFTNQMCSKKKVLIAVCALGWAAVVFYLGEMFREPKLTIREIERPTKRDLQYELARYKLEHVFVEYPKYLLGELQHVNNEMKFNQTSTSAFYNLLKDWSKVNMQMDATTEQLFKMFVENCDVIYAELSRLSMEAPANFSTLKRLLADVIDLQSLTTGELQIVQLNYGMSAKMKLEASQRLGRLVQNKIYALQHPTECSEAQLLYCMHDKNCRTGFGCQLHHMTYCLIMAFSLNRTLIFDTRGWVYPSNWTTWFLPLTSCAISSGQQIQHWNDATPMHNDAHIISIPRLGSFQKVPELIRLAVPDDITEEIILFHRFPPVWWIGQFLHYIVRPNTKLMQRLSGQANAMGFVYPIVGVHVRRTDKLIREAKKYPLQQYMAHVKHWYDDLDLLTTQKVARNVYLATDEPTVLEEAFSSFPEYKFLHTEHQGKRGTADGVLSIIQDIFFLSQTNYTVCTYSSNVCRAAYELAQFGRGDFANGFTSLDAIYNLDTKSRDNRTVQAFLPHKALRPGESDFRPGDLIKIISDDWNGTSHGILLRSKTRTAFPSYKTMPYFKRVPLKVPFSKMGHRAEEDLIN